jgi:hypothetical protein
LGSSACPKQIKRLLGKPALNRLNRINDIAAERKTNDRLPEIVQREEDGQYQVGWHDEADGPFPSRNFAEAVARKAGRS